MLVSGRVPFNILLWILVFFSKLINLHPPKKNGIFHPNPSAVSFTAGCFNPTFLLSWSWFILGKWSSLSSTAQMTKRFWLSRWWFQPTHLKNNRSSNWIISPSRGEHIFFKWNHHLAFHFLCVFCSVCSPKKITSAATSAKAAHSTRASWKIYERLVHLKNPPCLGSRKNHRSEPSTSTPSGKLT